MRFVREIVLGIAMLLISVTPAQPQEVHTNILTRVFLIRFGEKMGACFTIEVQDRQYLITARHNVDGIKDGDKIEIFQNEQWKPFNVKPLHNRDGGCRYYRISSPNSNITSLPD